MSTLQKQCISPSARFIDRILNIDTWLCLALFAVLPNLLFIVVSPWLIIRRALSPALYLVAAILALILPRAFTYPLFLLVAAIDGFLIVSTLFGLPFDTAFASIRFMAEIDISASLLYSTSLVCLFGIAIISAFLINHYRYRLRGASFVPAAVVVIALIWIDTEMNLYSDGEPATFQSALQQASMTSDEIVRNNRNVLVVLVEGMGAYADTRERDILESKLRNAVGTTFRLTHGINAHYGSTSGAISRELCGKWGTFATYLDGKNHDCLPSRLTSAGFETISYDAFASDLYSLRDWYPRIGIQNLNFREDMERDHSSEIARKCGTVVQGLCDGDVGKIVHRELAASNGRRKFVYWLTLNSHLPYTPIENGPLHCASDQARIPERIPCELTEIWMGVFDTVASIASDPNMPPLDIMVVGDHNTPMWSRAAASHFREGLVDWYRLEYLKKPAARLNGL